MSIERLPLYSKKTLRVTHNVWGWAQPNVPFGVDSFDDGVSDGDIIVVHFSRSLSNEQYKEIESWIDDHLTGGVFYLLNSRVFFANEHDAITFKMMYAMVNNLLDY